jgi:hypothetical protein
MPAITAAQITQAAQDHEDESVYGAVGTTTKCNFFVRDVVEALLQQSRPDMRLNSSAGVARANDQFDNLSSSADWSKQDFSSSPEMRLKDAHDAANAGTLVVVAYKNPTAGESGHIAVVVPASSIEHSSTWGMKMPFVAQAGRMNPRNLANETDKSVFSSLKLSFGFTPALKNQLEIFFYSGS